jgi:hypothetical protein
MIEVVRDGYAATKYILGYVLKSDTDTASQKRFEDFVFPESRGLQHADALLHFAIL